MASLVDTNILVYRYDRRFPEKQRVANELLRNGLKDESIRIPHQALLEFVAVVTHTVGKQRALLTQAEASREAEELLMQFPILYPTTPMFRTALRGATAYQLSWFDAHIWAYAEHFGLSEIISEDFAPGRFYGSVRARNPFLQF